MNVGMGKNKLRALEQVPEQNTPDQRIDIKRNRILLKHNTKINKLLNLLLWLPRKEDKYKISLLRLVLLSVPGIIATLNKVFSYFTGEDRTFSNLFPITQAISRGYDTLYAWINTHSFWASVVSVYFTYALFYHIYQAHKLDKIINNKLNRWLTFKVILNLFAIYGAVKFQVEFLQPVLYFSLYLLVPITILKLVALRKEHRTRGPYDPEQLDKRADRRERKEKYN
ncbi:hypothetical protein ACN92M_25320 (plasmid) [Paenibacillus polymyxa]|uniref:hypothetical protein n=1 Tax=Paenibacillus polymyxa TaxID=1406 RepID=UPI003B59A59A